LEKYILWASFDLAIGGALLIPALIERRGSVQPSKADGAPISAPWSVFRVQAAHAMKRGG
jgi:hypothetical protein